MKDEYRDDEIEIDLMEVFHLFLKKWWMILGCGIICGALAFVGTKMFITPQYESSAMIYLLSKSNAITSALDIQLGNQMTDDFALLATSRPVVEKVIKDENLDLTYNEMVEKVSITNPSGTQILKISVQDENPEVACELANAMAAALSERVADVMNTDKPNVVEDAVVAEYPVSPSTKKNTAIAALLGMVLVMGILLVNYLMDDRIKTEEDVIKYLELNTLASIPQVDIKKSPKSNRNSKKKKMA